MSLRAAVWDMRLDKARERIVTERDTLISLFPPSQAPIALTIDRLIAAYVDHLEHRLKDLDNLID